MDIFKLALMILIPIWLSIKLKNKRNKQSRILRIAGVLPILMIGLSLLGTNPYWSNSKRNEPHQGNVEIQAVIKRYDYIPEQGLQVIVTCDIDGKKVEKLLDRKTNDFSIGESMTVYYDENDPEMVYYKYPHGEELTILGKTGKWICIISGIIILSDFIIIVSTEQKGKTVSKKVIKENIIIPGREEVVGELRKMVKNYSSDLNEYKLQFSQIPKQDLKNMESSELQELYSNDPRTKIAKMTREYVQQNSEESYDAIKYVSDETIIKTLIKLFKNDDDNNNGVIKYK